MLQAQVAAQPREVQATPRQAGFPQAAQGAKATDAAPPARSAVTPAPDMAQSPAAAAATPAIAAPLAPQAPSRTDGANAIAQGANAAQPPAIGAASPSPSPGAAMPAMAATTGLAGDLAPAPGASAAEPALPFKAAFGEPAIETPQAPQAPTQQQAARPAPAAPAAIAAQLAAQSQPADASAQPQAPALPDAPSIEGKPKAEAPPPARVTAEPVPPSGKDAPDAVQAAAPQLASARTEASLEASAARGARVPAHPAIAQVAVPVARAAQDGVERITIKLQPPELGRIDVKIEVGADGRLQAVFAAERPATVDILQREVRELERALQGAGLDAGGGLSFGLRQNGGNGGHGAYAAPERGQPGTGRNAGEDDARQPLPPRTMAADGRVDIHV